MKHIYLIFLLMTLIASTTIFSLNVEEILDNMEKNENPVSQKATITQTIIKNDGRKSVSKLLSYTIESGNKGLIEYTSPARITGMKILTLNDGDDIWFYSPRTSRVRRIASNQKSQSVNGSDFSYADMSTKDQRKSYTAKLLKEEMRDGKKCYKIESKAKAKSEVYSRYITWVDKNTFVPVEVNYYDEDNALWKKLLMTGVKKKGEYYSADKIEMQNVMKNSSTIMKMEMVEYEVKIDPAMFSERYLRK